MILVVVHSMIKFINYLYLLFRKKFILLNTFFVFFYLFFFELLKLLLSLLKIIVQSEFSQLIWLKNYGG